jgi:hypothetical protein
VLVYVVTVYILVSDNKIDVFVYQRDKELKEGVKSIIKTENEVAARMTESKLTMIESLRERADQLRQETIKASEAEFVRRPGSFLYVFLISCKIEKLSQTKKKKEEEQRTRKVRVH